MGEEVETFAHVSFQGPACGFFFWRRAKKYCHLWSRGFVAAMPRWAVQLGNCEGVSPLTVPLFSYISRARPPMWPAAKIFLTAISRRQISVEKSTGKRNRKNPRKNPRAQNKECNGKKKLRMYFFIVKKTCFFKNISPARAKISQKNGITKGNGARPLCIKLFGVHACPAGHNVLPRRGKI